MTTRADELRDIIRDARQELSALELVGTKATNAARVGRCYRFRNDYGGSSGKWWLYARILRLADDGSLYGLGFQTDCHGKIEIEPERYFFDSDRGGWQEIPFAEFDAAWTATTAAVAALSIR